MLMYVEFLLYVLFAMNLLYLNLMHVALDYNLVNYWQRSHERHSEGVIRPQEGAIRQQKGAILPQEGAIRPQEWAIRPQEGAIRPQEGAIRQQKGAIRPQEWATRTTGSGYCAHGFW